MNAATPASLICSLALSAAAQSFNVGPNGTRTGTDNLTVLAPEPVRVSQELAMAELPVVVAPVTFYLGTGTSGRYGPYELTDGTVVGSKQVSYTLRMFDYGQHFSLQSTSQTNLIYGPFAATNGAPVSLGNASMTVLRTPAQMTVALSHPNRIAQQPMLGIAPLSQPCIQELYNLRAKYVALADRVDADTASAVMENVPRVHSNITGNSFTPVVKTSARDKQNALKGAELSAMVFLETLFNKAFRIRSQAITDGTVYHFQMPPGDYVLCATQRIKDPKAASLAGSVTAVWWTAFHFDGEHPISVALTAENAMTWRDIFQLSRAP